jgi:MFS family permease
MFLVSIVGLGAIVLSEEMPAGYRGRAVATAFGSQVLGAIAAAGAFPLVIRMGFGWRALYLIGGVMLPVVWFYRLRIHETQRWLARRELLKQGWLDDLKRGQEIFQERYRRSLVVTVLLWFLTNFWTTPPAFFFSYYALKERGWTVGMVGGFLMLSYLAGGLGSILAGPLMDRTGRRLATGLYFGLGAVATIVAFSVRNQLLIESSYVIVLALAAGVWPISLTISSELFPTSIRASANAIVNNLLGRTGMMLAPAAAGFLAAQVGSIGSAVAIISLLNFAVMPVILLLLPETRGQALEEIEARI